MKIPNVLKLFKQTGNKAGGHAVCVNKHGVYLTQINYLGGRPQVVECSFHSGMNVTSSLLEKICKKNRFSDYPLTTLLSTGEYQLMLVDAPNVPADELKTAVRWRIKDMLNFHVDDASVDVLQIPQGKFGGGRQQSIYAVAAPNATIQKHIALFEKAKLNLNVIDIPEMAQRNVAALFEHDEDALALLSFNDEGGLLTVTAGGELYLPRRIDITLGQLRDANEDLRQQNIEQVGLELQRSLDYVSRQYQQITVRKVLLAVPEGTGLEPALAHSVDMPVERLDLAQAMDISAVQDLARSEYAMDALLALGSALRQDRRAL
jgi:MSHA biogenesis protein MshI